ncbi:MAG: PKD domain-containing protein [Bacteroidota bacterium]|nr:PKD domain-containing protein [Bacteroidota bacterium]
MKKLVLNLFFFFLCFSIIQAQNIKQTFSLDFNSKSGLTYHQGYDRNSFSEVFTLVDDNVYAFLSQSEMKIILFDINKNEKSGEIFLDEPVYDMTYYNSQFWLTGKQDVFVLNNKGELINKISYKKSMPYIDKIIFNNGNIYFCDPAQNSYRIDQKGFIKTEGIPLNDGSFGFVSREEKSDIRFTRIINDNIQKAWQYTSDKKLGTVKIIGSSADKVILDVQYIVQEVPLKVERSIFILDISGEKIALEEKIKMPNVYYTYIRRDMLVHDHTLDIMISTPQKNMIYSVDLDHTSAKESLLFPQELYLYSYHYNNHLKSAKALEKESVNTKITKASITRTQIIANAEPYDTYVWTCTSANIKDEDCGGVHVTTPSWVQVGTNVSIPYMWGGWSTLPQYDQGIADGVSAGDSCTVGAGASSSCAVGVDCSGFVSVAWELPWKYGTSTLPDISTAYSSFDELKPGDIVNNAGSHVRLVHTCYGNGSWLIIEASASATNWSVGYSTYTTTNLVGSYIPRYYDDVIEGPVDSLPPTTSVSASEWETADFQVNFVDIDDLCLGDQFYMVSDYNGTEWRANADHGFFNDEFDSAINQEWTNLDGNWSVISGALNQSDETNSNTNIYVNVQQSGGNVYLYHWKMKISGSGTNRRAGIYIFSDDATQLQRNNAYMIYFRVDQNNCQIYKSTNNSISLESESGCTVNADEWYDCKAVFNTTTGKIDVYQDDILVGTWLDTSPHSSGNAISLRTGECNVSYDNIRIYCSRNSSETVTLGASNDIRYQNPSPAQPSCKIFSLITDSARFMSNCDSAYVNIDWTSPDAVALRDGAETDTDTIYGLTQYPANWDNPGDINSGINTVEMALGTEPGLTDVQGWTLVSSGNAFVFSDVEMLHDSMYYANLRLTNNAGLDTIVSSDGALVRHEAMADFLVSETDVCVDENVEFYNTSEYEDSVSWFFEDGSPEFSSLDTVSVDWAESGSYTVSLTAWYNGNMTDTTLDVNITKHAYPIPDFSALSTEVEMPDAFVAFVNESEHATDFYWDFGDENFSEQAEPWHVYDTTGVYTVMLVSGNDYCAADTLVKEDYITVHEENAIGDIASAGVSIYPNPANDKLYIEMSETSYSLTDVLVVDMQGKRLLEKSVEAHHSDRISIDLGQLAAGTYFIGLKTKDNVLWQQFEKIEK